MANPTTKGGVIMGSRENARSRTVSRDRDRVAARAKASPISVEVIPTKTARPRLFPRTRQKDL